MVQLSRVMLLASSCLLAGAAAAGCSGGSSKRNGTDSSKIATATLPAQLPDVRIVSGAAVPGSGSSTYTIQSGDTLAGIASRLGLSLEDLRAANPNADPSLLRSGQVIKLPAGASAPPPATAATNASSAPTVAATVAPATAAAPTDTPAAAPTEARADTPTATALGTTYVVQAGDFPAKIAETFGVSLEDLLAANPGINPTDLQVGDVIIIPPKRQP